MTMRRISDRLRRRLWGGSSQKKGCQHKDQIRDVSPSTDGCEECLKLGDEWVHLRLCMSCGKVGCCDDSKNKHASAHFREAGHPIIQSLEPGEEWLWCFADEMLLSSPKPPREKLPEGIELIDEL
jgi:uncharacterized UBP type Zn finger protein